MPGGSAPEVYLGQSAGPFFLPCHLSPGYGPGDARHGLHHRQCAGAATFRANIGVSPFLPKALLRHEADPSSVFASPEELLSHHKQIPIEEARAQMAELPLSELTCIQLARSTNRKYAVPA